MGTLISKPYSVVEGQEYAAYLERVLGECQRLLREGRLPDSEGIVAFLDDARLVQQQVKRDVTAAEVGGTTTTHSRVELTQQEYGRYLTMSESVRNLLEILELRDALVLNRTEAVARVADAIYQGEFVA